MRLSIFTKLFCSFLLVSLVLFSASALLINTSLKQGLQDYLNQQELEKVSTLSGLASSLYQEHGSWDPVRARPYLWADLLRELGEMPPPQRRMPGQKAPAFNGQTPLSHRINLLDAKKEMVLGPRENILNPPANSALAFEAIKSGDNTVGWIAIRQSLSIAEPLADSFFQHQRKQVYFIMAMAAAASLLIALMLMRTWLKPLKALRQGTQALIQGNLEHTISTRSYDEFDDLVSAFNHLSDALKHQKELREQWLADIAHELRTPLAVLRSEIEAMQDGIRQPTAAHIDSLHDQVLNLTKLVADLNTLSQTEHAGFYKLSEPLDYSDLAGRICLQNQTRFEQHQLSLEWDIAQGIAGQGDTKSITQLINNLLENSLRYTDAGGITSVTARRTSNTLELSISDTAPGVPDDSLGKLFERLYRVDKSRSRAEGGSGLGLAICQNIVRAHGGSITAGHSSEGGLCVSVRMPLNKESQ